MASISTMKTNHRVSELDPQDEKVVQLLTKLKNVNSAYPSGMLESRRQSFLHQMAGMGVGTGFKNSVKGGNGTGATPSTTGVLLEATLVVAIVIESLVLAYIYRDRLVEIFKSTPTSPVIHEVISPTVILSPSPELEILGIPVSVVPTEIKIPIVTNTPTLGVVVDDLTSHNEGTDLNNVGEATLTNSTPNPNSPHANNGNNGNHYGQTPKPERTKEKNEDRPPQSNPGNGNQDNHP